MYITLPCVLLLIYRTPTVFTNRNTILNQESEEKQRRKQRVTCGKGGEGAYHG